MVHHIPPWNGDGNRSDCQLEGLRDQNGKRKKHQSTSVVFLLIIEQKHCAIMSDVADFEAGALPNGGRQLRLNQAGYQELQRRQAGALMRLGYIPRRGSGTGKDTQMDSATREAQSKGVDLQGNSGGIQLTPAPA